MSQRASALSGVLALAANNPFGVGLAGLYTIGLLPQALAAPLVLVGLGAAVRLVRRPAERQWAVVLAAVIALVTITHSISTMVLGCCLVVLVLFAMATSFDIRRLRHASTALVVAVAGGIALAAFWLIPAIATFSERGIIATWATPTLASRMDDIINGR